MQEDTRKYVYFIEEHVAICHKRVVIREQHPARGGGGPWAGGSSYTKLTGCLLSRLGV